MIDATFASVSNCSKYHISLGANVGARSQNNEQTFLLGFTNEASNVAVSSKVVHTWLLFNGAPFNVPTFFYLSLVFLITETDLRLNDIEATELHFA